TLDYGVIPPWRRLPAAVERRESERECWRVAALVLAPGTSSPGPSGRKGTSPLRRTSVPTGSATTSTRACTGKVWNVTKHAVGVEVNKQVGILTPEDFRSRVKKNDQLKAEAKSHGGVISTKQQPEGPKPGFMVEGATLETVTPIPYDVVNDLKGGY
ncbi:hypothetical protein GW17_00010000, partial [Ensete ventricosum]